MKKIAFLLPLLVVLLGACKSTGVDLSRYNPVAIMTVYSNPSVPWYEERSNAVSAAQQSDDGILTGAVNRTLNRNNPETVTAQDRIDSASALLSERLRDCGIDVIDPTTCKDGTAYKNAGKGFRDYLGNTLPAVGYDALTSSNGRLNRAMCEESGAKAVLYATFRFQKVLVKDGVRNKGVAARVVLQVYGADGAGKKLFSREYTAVSSDYAELVKANIWDRAKVCALFPDPVNRTITAFLLDFAPFAYSDDRGDERETTPIAIRRRIDAPTTAACVEESANAVPAAVDDGTALHEKPSAARKGPEHDIPAPETERTELPAEYR